MFLECRLIGQGMGGPFSAISCSVDYNTILGWQP